MNVGTFLLGFFLVVGAVGYFLWAKAKEAYDADAVDYEPEDADSDEG